MDRPAPIASVRISGDEPGCRPSFGPTESHALGRADRLAAVGQLAGGLAHEMNTPLGSISAHAEEMLELIRDRRPSARQLDDLRGHLLAIMRQAHRCSRIASKLLQFARPSGVASETADVARVIDDVIELLAPTAKARGVGLEREPVGDLPAAPLDPAELEQLLHDLVQNGIDACVGGDIVRVSARAEDGRLRLIVEDTGCGISADHLDRIFDPFFTTKGVGQGTGLGLSVCHGLVLGAGGSIEVASAPGCGTRVTVDLPTTALAPLGLADQAAGDEPPAHRGGSGWRGTLLRSFRRSTFIPSALLPLALLAASGCSTREPSGSTAAPLSGPDATRTRAASATSPKPVVVVARADAHPQPAADPAPSAARLYSNYCAACHGEEGDGNGPGARFLYPRPRDFRAAQFRLVTTENRVPSDADLMRVVDRGMPGSAMFPFGHLPESERKALIGHVRKLVRKGIESQLRRQAAEGGGEIDPEELAEALKGRTEPGAPIAVPPDLTPPGVESVARGGELYRKNCATCHGETGRGDGVQEQKDEVGMPIRPRDFTRGIFKGGREREQIYARIVLGAPGTPMPATGYLKPNELGDLINYVLSLSDSSTPAKVEHRRTRLVARRARGPFPEAIPDPAWDGIEATAIVVSPLWWRDYPDPDLRVQALHDGRSIAIRLSWRDDTPNVRAIRPQDFPDMVALQLFKGGREPFLGMGSADGPVDVWLWNAAAQADLERYADVETEYPNMVVDSYPFEATGGDGPGLHPASRQPKEFLSAWGAGNLRSDPTHVRPGTDLRAKGFGSLTMRPAVSQSVRALGRRDGDRWTVVLRRPLPASADGGVALASGDQCSIAFALWDGAARDRNGQKLVSIWHDLTLE
jgi:mono/diheme cytochrome c family protein